MKKYLAYYVDGRMFEWWVTLSMIGLAIAMALDVEIMQDSAFQWVTLVLRPTFVEVFLVIIGWIRLIGLALNGHRFLGYRVGPIIRSLCAAACSVMWAQFGGALILISIYQGVMSPTVPFWITATLAEIYVAYRVMAGNGRTD